MTWQVKPLGELCEVLDSKRKPITKRDRVAGDYPYYGATGILDCVASYIFDEDLVLLGEDGAKWSAGENSAFIASGKYWVNNHAHVLRPLKDRLDQQWLVYFLNFEDLMPFVSGLTVPKLNQGSMREIQVPVPPLAEQHRIVAILDEAFAGIATAKANTANKLRNAAELFDGLRLAAFDGEGWDENLFEHCIEDVIYTNKVQRKHFLEEGDYPIISQEDAFINGYWSNAAHVFSVDRPLVLFGDHTKALKYVDFDFVLGADGVKILKPKPFLHPRFFYHQLRTAKLDSLGYARHYKLLKELVIRYPSPSEQQRIAGELDSVDEEAAHLESLYTRKLAALDELKQSLLQQAFTGQL